jgi:hypothetical protein
MVFNESNVEEREKMSQQIISLIISLFNIHPTKLVPACAPS